MGGERELIPTPHLNKDFFSNFACLFVFFIFVCVLVIVIVVLV